MRLIIAFDTDFNFKETDLVIAKAKPASISSEQYIKVDAITDRNYVAELEEFKTTFRSQAYPDFLKSIIESSINNFNRNWIIPLFKWIDVLDHTLSKYDFDEVLVVGYTKNINYIPYYEAEGEIGSQLLYKDWDVIPALLCEYLDQNKKINYNIVKTKRSSLLSLRVFVRRYVLLFFKVFLFLYKRTALIFKAKPRIDFKDVKFLFSTRSIAHTEFMYAFLKHYNKELVIHVNDGIHAGQKNIDYIRDNNFENFQNGLCSITYLDIFKALFRTLKGLIIRPKKQILNIRGIKINLSSAMQEMLISYFDALLYKSSIKNLVKDHKLILITGEMYTPFAYIVSQIGQEKGLKTIQLQTTSMMIRKEPNFVYCDKFVMNSKENKTLFQELYPESKDKIAYWGSLLIHETELSQKQERSNLKKLIYFTQPQVEEEQEFQIIDKLLALEAKLGFKLYIKLHPRERSDKLIRYNNALSTIDSKLIFNDYIKTFDLAVIRTTSLGASLILEGIPMLICLLTENSKKSKLDYIDHSYYGTLFELDMLEDRMRNYSKLSSEFESYRTTFIRENELDKGINHFYSTILE